MSPTATPDSSSHTASQIGEPTSGGPTRRLVLPGLAAAVGLATIAAMFASGGDPILTVAPVLLVLGGLALARIPLRWSAAGFVFMLLALDISTDAGGIWSSPLAPLGDLLGGGFSGLTRTPFAGFEVVALLLFILATWRHATRDKIDGTAVPTAGVMRTCLVFVVMGCVYAMALGATNGYGLALWKARYLLHPLLFFALFQTCFQQPEDFRSLGTAVVAAAIIKALMAAWVQIVAAPALTGGRLAYATNHGDSLLFAMAVLVLVLPALVTWTRRSILRAIIFLPLPLWGMLLNNRRLVWAILALAIIVIFLATSWRPWKRRVLRYGLTMAPVLLLYGAVGWKNVNIGGIFTPIAKIRTMLDSKVDNSTLWRDREAWNIAATLQARSPLGIGLGGEYQEFVFNDDIAGFYPDYRGWPHNTVLGLLLLLGIPGFVIVWLPNLITLFLAFRAELFATTPVQRTAALVAIGAVVAVLALAWGDTGAHFIQYKLAAGLAMALASKLAVATGAWPAPGARDGREARRGPQVTWTR